MVVMLDEAGPTGTAEPFTTRFLRGAWSLPQNSGKPKKSQGEIVIFQQDGAAGGIRTPDPNVRSVVLYPTELRPRTSEPHFWGSRSYHINFAPQEICCLGLRSRTIP
jgi:hypothetical protein